MEPTTAASRAEAVLAEHREYLFPVVTPYYAEPLVLERGEGTRVWDADGREYLDFFAGILTSSVGHCHPHVVERTQAQVARLGHTSTLYVTEPQVRAAKKLAELAPGALRRAFFTNSGSEAIETALTLARIHTGRSEIIALRQAYHGRSTLAATVTAQAPWRPLASSVAGVTHTLAPYPYRCPFHREGEACGERCAEAYARDLEEVILTTTNGAPAALIAETIQGVAGYVVPQPSYFRRVAEVIRRHGGLLIVDEVQAGFGRTGGKWFGIEHWGVVPDIMVMAKGIAGGMPVGATLTTDEIAASWKGKTISTFGGHPVAMAAMVATLEVLEEADAPASAEARGRRLAEGLAALARRHGWIGDARGMGLMQALELVEEGGGKEPSPRRAKALLEAAKDEGLLVGLGGLHGHVIRLGPHLLITDDEVDDALARLGRACEAVG